MRPIVLLLVSLAIAGYWIALVEPASASDPLPVNHVDWVRTTRGWEKLDTLPAATPTPMPLLHPAIVAGGQLLGSLLALVAWPGGKP